MRRSARELPGSPWGWPRDVLRVLAVALALLGCEQGGSSAAPAPVPAAEVAAPAPVAAPVDPAEPPAVRPPAGAVRSRIVYVPAYSHLPGGRSGGKPSLLSVLLSVRNVDPAAAVTLTHVDYYDTKGHRVRRYLAQPQQLHALETVEFSVDTLDEAGGSGANFLVYWEGPEDAHELLTETIMLGHMGAGYVSFTSRGIELDRRPDAPDGGPAPAQK